MSQYRFVAPGVLLPRSRIPGAGVRAPGEDPASTWLNVCLLWRLHPWLEAEQVGMTQDMRISNIMEHRGDAPYIPKGFKDDKKKKKNQKPVMLLRGEPFPRPLRPQHQSSCDVHLHVTWCPCCNMLS